MAENMSDHNKDPFMEGVSPYTRYTAHAFFPRYTMEGVSSVHGTHFFSRYTMNGVSSVHGTRFFSSVHHGGSELGTRYTYWLCKVQ